MSSTTTGLSNLMSIFYDKVFLERAMLELRFDFGAQVKRLPKNSGKQITFNRFSPLAVATTALSEAVNPTAVDMTSTQVTAAVAEYGTYVKVGSLFELTSIDVDLKEHVEVMGQNAGETVDTLIRNELSANATAQLAAASLTAIAATDTLTGAQIRKAVRTLKANKAKRFDNGFFRGIVSEYPAYDLMANSEWLDAYRYTDAENIRRGVIGRIHGVEFVETNNGSTEASTVTVYHTFIFGKNSYGTVRLDGQEGSRIYVKQSGPNDTSNPINMYSTVGWKVTFVAKVLNSSWIINVKTGATA